MKSKTTNFQKTSLHIVLVGRPNVGKSRLFNRLCKRRVSIVHDQVGVTRDVIPMEMSPGIMLMDTGGIGLSSQVQEPLIDAIEEQISVAIAIADMTLFVVDASVGCLPLDFEIAQKLRHSGTPVCLLANKVDLECHQVYLDTFCALGFGPALAVSAEHGRGEDEIRHEIQRLAERSSLALPSLVDNEARIAICFAGKTNMGKSSLLNALFGEKKAIVSPIPGTTRDLLAFHLDFETAEGKTLHFRLVDTAGLKAKKKLSSSIEYFSHLRSVEAIEDSQVVFLVLESLSAALKQDKQIAARVLKAGKGLIVVVNKWDLAEEAFRSGNLKHYKTLDDFRKSFQKSLQRELLVAPGASIMFTSAYDRASVEVLLREADQLFTRMNQQIPTAKLNRVFQQLMERQPPALSAGRRFKIYYVVQVGNFPFRFKVFCNQEERLSGSYERYLENGLRKHFPLEGCPLQFEWIGKKKEPNALMEGHH